MSDAAPLGPYQVRRAPFAFDDDPSRVEERPAVLVLERADGSGYITLKVTSCPRDGYPGEVAIQDWRGVGLDRPSTVRACKALEMDREVLESSQLYGTLSSRDADAVFDAMLECLFRSE